MSPMLLAMVLAESLSFLPNGQAISNNPTPYYTCSLNGVARCKQLCNYQSACAMYEYDTMSHTCALHMTSLVGVVTGGEHVQMGEPQRSAEITASGCLDTDVCVRHGGDRCRCFPLLDLSPALSAVDCGRAPYAVGTTVSTCTPCTGYGSVAHYSCLTGYQYQGGENASTCLSTGLWSLATIICEEIDCGQPSPIIGSNVTVTTTTYDSTATYACSEGYDFVNGSVESRCQLNSTWSTVSILCQEIDCGYPPTISGSNVTAATTTYDSTATYACNESYDFVNGSVESRCLLNRTWSTVSIHCQLKDCNTPTYVDGAIASYTTTYVGSIATYVCVKGLQAAGSGTMATLCTSSGTWETILITCTAMTTAVWEQIATTSGEATPAAQVDALLQRVTGCKPKMKIKQETATGTKIMKTFAESASNGVLRAQTGNSPTKTSWNSFETSPSRAFDLYITSGQGTHLEAGFTGEKTITRFTSTYSWFVRTDPCVESIDLTDTLANVLRTGASGAREIVFHIGSSAVAGQLVGEVSLSGYTFQSNPYWYTVKRLTSGNKYRVRWHLNGHFLNTDEKPDTMPWCVDTCWHSALGGGSLGSADLNVQHLIEGVKHGPNILVITSNDIVTKATDIYIYEGHVTVVTKQFWTPTDSTQFSDTARTSWIVTSTAGYEKQCLQVPESAIVDRIKERNGSTSWFVDSRKWDHALQIDKNGNVISGSRSQLLTFLEEGRNLRVGVAHTSGQYVAMEIDTVDFTNGSHIAAEAVNRVDLVWSSSEYTFTSTCRLRSSIITTEGTYRVFKYDLGVGGTHNEITDVLTIDWFVEL